MLPSASLGVRWICCTCWIIRTLRGLPSRSTHGSCWPRSTLCLSLSPVFRYVVADQRRCTIEDVGFQGIGMCHSCVGATVNRPKRGDRATLRRLESLKAAAQLTKAVSQAPPQNCVFGKGGWLRDTPHPHGVACKGHALCSVLARWEIIRSPVLRGELWAGWIQILISMQAGRDGSLCFCGGPAPKAMNLHKRRSVNHVECRA